MQIPTFFPEFEYGSDSNTYWGVTLLICLFLLALSYFEISFKKK